jgi:hypothetical protein
MIPSSGTRALMARPALQTRFFGLRASYPFASRRLGSVYGKSATAGMPNRAARSASRTAWSMLSRSTPGIERTSSRPPAPAVTKSGQIRSSTLSVCSRTSRLTQSAFRFRRGRRVSASAASGVLGCAWRRRGVASDISGVQLLFTTTGVPSGCSAYPWDRILPPEAAISTADSARPRGPEFKGFDLPAAASIDGPCRGHLEPLSAHYTGLLIARRRIGRNRRNFAVRWVQSGAKLRVALAVRHGAERRNDGIRGGEGA